MRHMWNPYTRAPVDVQNLENMASFEKWWGLAYLSAEATC